MQLANVSLVLLSSLVISFNNDAIHKSKCPAALNTKYDTILK